VNEKVLAAMNKGKETIGREMVLRLSSDYWAESCPAILRTNYRQDESLLSFSVCFPSLNTKLYLKAVFEDGTFEGVEEQRQPKLKTLLPNYRLSLYVRKGERRRLYCFGCY